MTSRRRYPLPALRGALAVLGVAVFIATLIVTGRQAPTVRPVALVSSLIQTPPVPAPDVDVDGGLAPLLLRPTGASTADTPAPAQRTRVTRAKVRPPLHRWVRPNWGPLTSPFGMRWGRLHAGIDLGGPYGSLILAATDGCISYAGPEQGYGEVTIIRDWDGTETVYGHMSAFLKRTGCVEAGTPIARVGSAGDATGPHLHFEVRVGGVPVNPIPFLAKRGLHI